MPFYTVTLEGSRKATQWWLVLADNCEDAITRCKEGEGEAIGEGQLVAILDA